MSVITKEKLAACEKRAIEIYYAAPPDKLAGDCWRELEAEFGKECVNQMMSIGIGNNHLNPEVEIVKKTPKRICQDCGGHANVHMKHTSLSGIITEWFEPCKACGGSGTLFQETDEP